MEFQHWKRPQRLPFKMTHLKLGPSYDSILGSTSQGVNTSIVRKLPTVPRCIIFVGVFHSCLSLRQRAYLQHAQLMAGQGYASENLGTISKMQKGQSFAPMRRALLFLFWVWGGIVPSVWSCGFEDGQCLWISLSPLGDSSNCTLGRAPSSLCSALSTSKESFRAEAQDSQALEAPRWASG